MAFITELLNTGKDNAIKASTLADALEVTTRDISQAVEQERRHGCPICASTGKNPGYYLAANKEEMQEFCNSLKGRGIEIFKTRQACLSTIPNLPSASDPDPIRYEPGELEELDSMSLELGTYYFNEGAGHGTDK